MAKNTHAARRVEEIQDISKDMKAEKVRVSPVEYKGKKKQVLFKTLVCADYGVFMPGEKGEIPEKCAEELEKLGKCSFLKDEESGTSGGDDSAGTGGADGTNGADAGTGDGA